MKKILILALFVLGMYNASMFGMAQEIVLTEHLPEIQSAQEMQENGVNVSELQTQLLQKIEELTLYLIQQEQTIKELRK